MLTFLQRSSFVQHVSIVVFGLCLLPGDLSVRAGAQTHNPAVAPAAGEALTIDKIDPPNWFATLPKPMLLVKGTGLGCAGFSVSDASLAVERVEKSTNGHWAQVYLSASPASAETVTLRAACPGGATVRQSYTFAARRAASSGMAGFSPRDVMYLIMTDRFADGDLRNDGPLAHDDANSAAATAERATPKGWHGGDLRGVEQHLNYLQKLGATAVWLTPVYQNHSPVAYHGYHATDYYAVDEHFGTLADLQSLAAALHGRGMKLVLDTVPNHTGPLHPWVLDEPAPYWFHGTAAHHMEAQTDFHPLVDPHASERDRTPVLDGWFVDELPDNNTDNAAVALYQRQNAVWWIEETGADALRIDTFPYVDRPFWNAFNGELKQLYPRLTEVGEVSNGDPEITSAFAGGVTRAGVDTQLTTPFDFPFYYAARDVFGRGEGFLRMENVLAEDGLYPHPEQLVTFLSNHDDARLATDVPDAAERRLAWALLYTTRGTPQLYAGNEIAMTGGDDPANRSDFPGGFPGAPSDAFTAAGRDAAQNAELAWVTHLGALRRQYGALACGKEQVLATQKNVFAYARYGDDACPASTPNAHAPQAMLVLLQRGPLQPLTIDLRETALASCRSFAPVEGQATVQLAGTELVLTPQQSFTLLTCEKQ